MKTFNVEFVVEYEGYNGYDHTIKFNYQVAAKNTLSAQNKAKKLLKRGGGGYLQRGSIYTTTIKEITPNDNH